MSDRPMFEMSADSRLLYQRLRRAAVDEVVTYTELSAEIHRPVSGATPALRTAIDAARRDDDIVFAAVRGIGMKRLNDVDIVDQSTADAVAIRRRAKRAAVKLTKVSDYSALPAGKQLEHTARLSIFAAIAEISSDKSIRKVAAAAGGRAGELPISETLRAFVG